MKSNPILKKELVLGARSIKLPLALFFYSGLLSLIAVSTLGSVSNTYYYYGNMNFETLTSVFMTLACIQAVIICIIIPVLTAGSIAGERERQTLDLMLTAPVSPRSIVMGKLLASMSQVFLFVISSLPAMGIAFLYGGIQWRYLLVFMVAIMCLAFFCGSIGIWCSSVYKKTIISVIMTMAVELIFFLGSFLVVIAVYYIKYEQAIQATGTYSVSNINIGWIPLVLLLNPAVGFADALITAYTGSRGIEVVMTMISGHMASGMTKLYPYWSVLSLAVTLLLGFWFVMLAARRIDSVRRKEKHMKVKKKGKK